MTFWDFLVWTFWFYIVIVCITIFIRIFIDIFRDPELNGWAKALWCIFLVLVPFLAAFIYLIARGGRMAQRANAGMMEAQAANDQYIRSVAAGGAGSAVAHALLGEGGGRPTLLELARARVRLQLRQQMLGIALADGSFALANPAREFREAHVPARRPGR